MKLLIRALALLLISVTGLSVLAHAAETKAPAAAKKSAKAKSAPAAALPSLTWRGDYCTARAFMKDLAHDYEAAKLGKVTLQPFSTVSGLDAVHDGTVDIAGSARPPMPDRPEESGTNFIAVAWDGLVMITSPKNPVSNVTLKQLHDIYLGRITNWSALGGPDGPINLYAVAAPLDGNEYSLRDLLFHHGDQDVAVPRLYMNTEKLEEGISIDPHGLGLTTFSTAHAGSALKILTIEDVTPSTAAIADGTYPLYSTLFLAVRDDARNKGEIDKFVQFVASEPATAVLRRHGLVPYRDAPNLVDQQAQRVAFIDARVRPEALAATSIAGTPVSAPVATADFLPRISDKAQEARRVLDERKQQQAAKPPGS